MCTELERGNLAFLCLVQPFGSGNPSRRYQATHTPLRMSDLFRDIAETPKEFLRDGTQFINRYIYAPLSTDCLLVTKPRLLQMYKA